MRSDSSIQLLQRVLLAMTCYRRRATLSARTPPPIGFSESSPAPCLLILSTPLVARRPAARLNPRQRRLAIFSPPSPRSLISAGVPCEHALMGHRMITSYDSWLLGIGRYIYFVRCCRRGAGTKFACGNTICFLSSAWRAPHLPARTAAGSLLPQPCMSSASVGNRPASRQPMA